MKQLLILFILFIVSSCTNNKKVIPVKKTVVSNKQKNNIDNATNVIFILADDLGFGDIQAYNSKSTIQTKNINYLANNGVKFTNAHTNSSVCTPTRYGILTGTYAWRTKLKKGVLNGFSPPLIKQETTTIAEVFKNKGYKTACIGKWHLGMDMPMTSETKKNKKEYSIDIEKAILEGPTTHGFDYFYGISASLDFPPYIYIRNNSFVGELDHKPTKKQSFPAYLRSGIKSQDFSFIDCLDNMTDEARKYIRERKKKKEKFFLYFALTAPHKPVIPHSRFKNKTSMGSYGDFIYQIDWTVGQIIQELKEQKILKNTMIILTSDNGSFMYNLDNLDRLTPKRVKNIKKYKGDHIISPQIQGFFSKNHRPNYIYRGTKADIWEAGHRIPFIVYWQEGIKNNKRSTDIGICVTDFFSTACDLLNYQKTATEGKDSYSFLPLLKNKKMKPRPAIIHHSINGTFAIRKGIWKLILSNGSGGREIPTGKPFQRPFQLFNMKVDPQETYNFIEKDSNIAKNLEEEFKVIFNAKKTVE